MTLRERLFFFVMKCLNMLVELITDETNDMIVWYRRSIARGVSYDDITHLHIWINKWMNKFYLSHGKTWQ